MKKLLLFQERVGAIAKDSKNPFFKSSYFDINKLLEEVKPILTELKLAINQPLSNINGKPAIRTVLTDCESNEIIFDDTTTLPENSDPQKMGSAITYFRRYALQSLLALQAEDDDGNNSKPAKSVQPSKKENIAKLLKKHSKTELKTIEDYKDACINITGFELIEENYDLIINFLKTK